MGLLATFGVFAPSAIVHAQSTAIDPSSALLLNSGNRNTTVERPSPSQGTRLESSRYTTRPRERIERSSPTQPSPTPLPNRRANPTVEPSPTPVPEEVAINPVDDEGTVVVPIGDSANSEAAPRVIEGRSESLLEVSLGTGYLYENSSSSYSFRKFSLAAPTYFVDAKVWLSSEFGIGGSTYSTMGATLSDGSRDLAVTRSELAAGIFYRRNFSDSRHYVFGVEFLDQQLRVPTDSAARVKTKSSGVRISMTGRWEDWGMGLSFAPKQAHEETSDSGTRSGTSVDSYRVGFHLERRWKFNSSSAMHIRLRHDVEQISFGGSATSPDQVTGSTPDGVGVTVGTTVIQFGFDWGQ